MEDQILNIFWHRRDLRIDDNAGLYHALTSGKPVQPIFIFDTEILGELEDESDARVQFIHEYLSQLQEEYRSLGASLDVRYGKPVEIFGQLLNDYKIFSVFTNKDYEPYAVQRDKSVWKVLQKKGIGFEMFKDHVIFEQDEIMKDNGEPYTIFTPYSKKWKAGLTHEGARSYPARKHCSKLFKREPLKIPTLGELGFERTGIEFPPAEIIRAKIKDYHNLRDYPAKSGTTRLSVHLRFGTLSIRKLVQVALESSDKFLGELIWRDFYQAILWNFPHVVHRACKQEYDNIEWRNDEKEFKAWCDGMTGYPLVDAGMRELNHTGYMHNRVRMVTASFLTKHLLIDWRWGEAYFAKKLLDFELASNNGGWQWAAGTGCDAAPYFRIFNPTIQAKKFDPDLEYIRKWVPELDQLSYPEPIVKHEFARKRCLEVYGKAVKVD